MEKKLTEGPVDPFGMENEMEKGKPKVSVVIPVYNTEKYLEATLQSIRNQICCEIEIIVIDDGSTDCSAEIVRRAADEDGRIVLVSQPNRGLSLARNAGIARASGEFVYFMDSDDLRIFRGSGTNERRECGIVSTMAGSCWLCCCAKGVTCLRPV